VGFHVSFEWIHVILPLFKKLFTDGLTSCYRVMTFALWSMLSLLIPFQHGFFCMLFHLASGPNGGGSNKKWTLPWLTPSGCISCLSCKGFWLFAPTNEQFPSLMCLHDTVNKRFWWPFSSYFAFFFIGKELIVLQRTQVTSILRCFVILGEGFSTLIVLSNSPSFFFFFDMLLGISVGFGTWFVLMPLNDPHWVLLFWLGFGSFFCSFVSPLVGCFFYGVC
jgi:hypothetical protein